ncbi:MAG: mechanosensitive ion channel protein, partial [Gammaproteobacteria bacterium]|nr:mechanosensitive ion channel protein [Gammaproteobacteria bacterium]
MAMDLKSITELSEQITSKILDWISSPLFYSQLGLILLATILAFSFSSALKRHSPIFRDEPKEGSLQ